METKISLPHSQVPPPVPTLNQYNPVHDPHPFSGRFILLLSSHLHLCLPSGLLPSGFHQNNVYTSALPHTCYMPHLYHFYRMMNQIIFSQQYWTLSFSLCSFIHSPVTSPRLGPIFSLIPYSQTNLSLRSSLIVSDQVSHPIKKTTGKNIVLYVLSFIFLDSKLKDERFRTELMQAFPD